MKKGNLTACEIVKEPNKKTHLQQDGRLASHVRVGTMSVKCFNNAEDMWNYEWIYLSDTSQQYKYLTCIFEQLNDTITLMMCCYLNCTTSSPRNVAGEEYASDEHVSEEVQLDEVGGVLAGG